MLLTALSLCGRNLSENNGRVTYRASEYSRDDCSPLAVGSVMGQAPQLHKLRDLRENGYEPPEMDSRENNIPCIPLEERLYSGPTDRSGKKVRY